MPPRLTHSDRERLAKIGAAIRQAREARGLSLRQAADRAGVHHMTRWALERGTGNPTIAAVARAARALGAAVTLP